MGKVEIDLTELPDLPVTEETFALMNNSDAEYPDFSLSNFERDGNPIEADAEGIIRSIEAVLDVSFPEALKPVPLPEGVRSIAECAPSRTTPYGEVAMTNGEEIDGLIEKLVAKGINPQGFNHLVMEQLQGLEKPDESITEPGVRVDDLTIDDQSKTEPDFKAPTGDIDDGFDGEMPGDPVGLGERTGPVEVPGSENVRVFEW